MCRSISFKRYIMTSFYVTVLNVLYYWIGRLSMGNARCIGWYVLNQWAWHCCQGNITQKMSDGMPNVNTSANLSRAKQQNASAVLAAHGLGPLVVWIRNSQFRALPMMELEKPLMPSTMRPFHSRSRKSLTGVDRRVKALWQADEEFIWNVWGCWGDWWASRKAVKRAFKWKGRGIFHPKSPANPNWTKWPSYCISRHCNDLLFY